jgi:hypothetical protein
VRVLAGGVARVALGEPRTTTFGARLELSRRFAAPWDAGIDVEGARAERLVDLGEVEIRLFSAAAWFGARAGGSGWSATAGLGGRVGVSELSGAPGARARGHDALRPFAGPLLFARGDGALGQLALALVLEGGLVAVGAEGLAGGAEVIGLTGGFVAASANAGVRF